MKRWLFQVEIAPLQRIQYTPMTNDEKEILREKIQKKISRTEKYIVELEELIKPIPPENAIGRVSRMDAINNRSVNEATHREVRNRLAALKEALEDIDKSHFGKCVKCGNSIPIQRLALVPESKRCVKCA